MSVSKIVPLTLLQRSILLSGSAIGTLVDPTRGDLLAALTETAFPICSLRKVRNIMMQNITGRYILDEKPRITDEMLAKWSKLRKSNDKKTFAYAYVNYMNSNGFTPSGRSEVRFLRKPDNLLNRLGIRISKPVDDAEFADLVYILQRYRETHDFLHALTGLSSSEYDEGLLKYFEWTQMGLPTNLLSVAGAGIRIGINSATKGYLCQINGNFDRSEGGPSFPRRLKWMQKVSKDFKHSNGNKNFFYLNRLWEKDIESGISLQKIREDLTISKHF